MFYDRSIIIIIKKKHCTVVKHACRYLVNRKFTRGHPYLSNRINLPSAPFGPLYRIVEIYYYYYYYGVVLVSYSAYSDTRCPFLAPPSPRDNRLVILFAASNALRDLRKTVETIRHAFSITKVYSIR